MRHADAKFLFGKSDGGFDGCAAGSFAAPGTADFCVFLQTACGQLLRQGPHLPVEGAGTGQNAEIDPGPDGGAAGAPVAAAAAGNLLGAPDGFLNAVSKVKPAAAISAGGEQHAGNQDMVFGAVHVYGGQGHGLRQQHLRILFPAVKQRRSKQRRQSRTVTGIADVMTVLTGAGRIECFPAVCAGPAFSLCMVDQRFPAKEAPGMVPPWKRGPAGACLLVLCHAASSSQQAGRSMSLLCFVFSDGIAEGGDAL